MVRVLMVTPNPDSFLQLAEEGTSRFALELEWAGSGAEALEKAAENTPQLAVIDEDPGDMKAFDVVVGLMKINAMINTAVVSRLAPEEFHDAAEGLGILAQLPPRPEREESGKFWKRVMQMGITAPLSVP